jgi:hypothetical protein
VNQSQRDNMPEPREYEVGFLGEMYVGGLANPVELMNRILARYGQPLLTEEEIDAAKANVGLFSEDEGLSA